MNKELKPCVYGFGGRQFAKISLQNMDATMLKWWMKKLKLSHGCHYLKRIKEKQNENQTR